MQSFLQAKLSRRIVLWVFGSILVIEAIILLPSIYRRQQELLTSLKNLSAARVEGSLAALGLPASDTDLLATLQQMAPNSVRGGTLYRASGELVGSFGEVPQLTLQQVQANRTALYDQRTAHYDAVWSLPPLADRYFLIIRHDASSVQRELLAFIGRIALLVMIISVFVTVATLIGLERILVTPILLLRNDLLKLGQAIRQDQPLPEFKSLPFRRDDELGEVIAAFDAMYAQVWEAISERKQAEVALRQSEEKFSRAFRASPSAVLISTLTDGRLIEVNDSFLQLYGGQLEEVLGHTATDLNLWAAAEHRAEMVDTIRKTGSIRNREYTFRNKQGEPRAILFSAELINLNGEECLLSVANDITERRQTEKALERLAEIGELAAMIVHEVRNPLTTVIMGLQSFQTLELSDRARLRLELALEEAERLQRLLNEILQYARCQKLDLAELELNTLIQEMLETMRTMPAAQGRPIEFTPVDPIRVLGDRDKLKQVFINLISNACEAVALGESITWKIDACQPQRTVCVQIHNGGEPIPGDLLPRLTKPFFTTKSSGNGLGLAIVKQIVEAHNGELMIDSSESIGGTTVTVMLPFVSEQLTLQGQRRNSELA
ncbi:MAG: PAS domain S-box protein [Elainella sp. C42_A2020_010]|nr:PAS domain S-box protein [Elainella sp. C42_A2020_010]RNJ70538.1 MAG: PAS domain S-box protein [Leptolyngbya sp. IPPAS B-1204]